MIAGCNPSKGGADCAGCRREQACAQLFRFRFGGVRRARPPAPASGERTEFAKSPLGLFLGEIARGIEARIAARPAPSARSAFRGELERRLEPRLSAGAVGMEEVARAMGLSRQTLYRRLKNEGTTFEGVLDGLRRRLALRFLKEERLSVKEAAYRLGFADPAAFSRAFKRWTGMSPSAARGSA